MIDLFSFGASAVCGATAAYTIHQNRRHLSPITRELQSLLNECSRLETLLTIIDGREREQHHQGLASNSRLDLSAIVPMHDALRDAAAKLIKIRCFTSCILEKAQKNNKGDHWEWIRKRNNIDRLRAELRSISDDLTVCYDSPSSGNYNTGRSLNREAIQAMQQRSAPFNFHRAKTEDRLVSNEIWSQLCQEYQLVDLMSPYRQRPRVQAIQAPNHSESETCPIVQDPSSFWLGVLPCSCIGRRLPSSPAITPKLVSICSNLRTCYILVALGMVSIAGSLALALWRSINNSDIQGGFSIAQYVLAVGGLIIGCVLVIHSRTCSCWSSSLCTGEHGTLLLEGHQIKLQQPG